MVKRTLELFECDLCGEEGQRYTVIFPDGQMTLDRCGRHNTRIEKMRAEKGEWVARTPGGRSSFKVSSLEEIEQRRQNGK